MSSSGEKRKKSGHLSLVKNENDFIFKFFKNQINIMFSPAGEEFCIEENIAKDSSCKVGDSGARMEIKV